MFVCGQLLRPGVVDQPDAGLGWSPADFRGNANRGYDLRRHGNAALRDGGRREQRRGEHGVLCARRVVIDSPAADSGRRLVRFQCRLGNATDLSHLDGNDDGQPGWRFRPADRRRRQRRKRRRIDANRLGRNAQRKVLTVQGVSGGTSVPVTGNFWQSTQPVSISSLPALSPARTRSARSPIQDLPNPERDLERWVERRLQYGRQGRRSAAGATLDSAAGTANRQALTIQGNSSGIAVPTSLASFPSLAAGSETIGSIDNIYGAVSLPTGAATSANQPTNAAQASADGAARTEQFAHGRGLRPPRPLYTSGQTDTAVLDDCGSATRRCDCDDAAR